MRLAQILLTVAAIQYGFMPPIADFTESHVFHEAWPPHARLHLVWLLAIGTGISTYVIYLVWRRTGNHVERLKLASFLGVIVLGGFFAATATQNYYGGALSDPMHEKLILGINANFFTFSVAALLQIIAILIIWRKSDHSS